MLQRLQNELFRPVDPASLVAFRVIFGLMAALSAARFLWYGWVDRFFYQRTFFFHFPGFEWAAPLPSPGMYVLFWALIAAGLAIAAGLFYRLSVTVFLIGFTYVGLIDTTNYLNHYWFVRFAAFLMLFMPLGKVHSVDAWWRERFRGQSAPETVPAWPVWALRGQIGVVYFFAGVAKLNYDWLVRGQPLEIWLSARTHLPVIGPVLGYDWVPHVMSWAGAIFDLSIFFVMLVPGLRAFGYAAVVSFHAATGFLFNIGMFPVIMMGITLIFFAPDWPKRVWRWVRGVEREGVGRGKRREASGVGRGKRRLVTAGLAVWFAIQLLVPARAVLHPGDVNWTMEGFRFAWRVKLVERGGYLQFRVRDPESGKTWKVNPSRYLTRRQVELASVEPPKILQLAHHIARQWREKGYEAVEVYADARVSVNGRPSRRLVDPKVDLAQEERTMGYREWVLR